MADEDLPTVHELRQAVRPDFEVGTRTVRCADLFCGCGGLTLGVAQACRDLGIALEVPLAADFDSAAAAVYSTNFPKATVHQGDVQDLFDGILGSELTEAEKSIQLTTRSVQFLVAGPPCQGHSNLNNHTRRSDPKNRLYLLVARAAEVLQPAAVFIENVPAVRHDTGGVVALTIAHLQSMGFHVAQRVVHLDVLGIPQRRRRHVVLALQPELKTDPADVLAGLATKDPDLEHDMRWAIADLAAIEGGAGVDRAPRAKAENLRRMEWLLANDEYDLPNDRRPECHQNEEHSYRSMYGRLRWDAPAQTITSGFGSIGQGRYMHPDKCRALTPHEAARIQGFPDYFEFSPLPHVDPLAMMIANAVPPQLARRVFQQLVTLASQPQPEDDPRFED